MAQRAAIVTEASSGIGLAHRPRAGRGGPRADGRRAAPREARGGRRGSCATTASTVDAVAGTWPTRRLVAGGRRAATASASAASTCSSTTRASAFGEAVDDLTTKKVDLQLATNLRSPILFYRECAELLRAAGAEHRCALVVNTASISGKSGQPWLSVYSATKAAVVGFTQAMHKELGGARGQVDGAVPGLRRHADDRLRQGAGQAEEMIQVSDIAEVVRVLLQAVARLHRPRGPVPAARGPALGSSSRASRGGEPPEAEAPAPRRPCARARAPGARRSRRRGPRRRARPGSTRQMRPRARRSSRAVAARARLAPVKRSQARAKESKLVRPPRRWAASIGQTPPARSE